MHETLKNATEKNYLKCDECDIMKEDKYYFMKKAIGETKRNMKRHHALTHSYWAKFNIFNMYDRLFFKDDGKGGGGYWKSCNICDFKTPDKKNI